MVTKVLMHIHTEKQKERVKFHEPYIQLAPNTQNLIIHPTDSLSHSPKTLASLTLHSPHHSPPSPMPWKRSLSSKTLPTMTHCKSPPSLTLDPPPILILQIPHHSPQHICSNRHTLLHQPDHGYLGNTEGLWTRKEGPLWFALSRRIQLVSGTGSPDLLLCLPPGSREPSLGPGDIWGSDPLLRGP